MLESLRIQGEGNCATVERLYQRLRYYVPQLTRQYRHVAQTPYGVIEPPSKNHLILLPRQATLPDIVTLKNDALRAEVQHDFQAARQLYIRVLAASPADLEAIEGIERLSQGSTVPQPAPIPKSSKSAPSPANPRAAAPPTPPRNVKPVSPQRQVQKIKKTASTKPLVQPSPPPLSSSSSRKTLSYNLKDFITHRRVLQILSLSVITVGGAVFSLVLSFWQFADRQSFENVAADSNVHDLPNTDTDKNKIRNADQVATLNTQLRRDIIENRNRREFGERLEYRVQLAEDGALIEYEALNDAAKRFVTETPLPGLPKSIEPNVPQADFLVVITEGGIVQVSPFNGWNQLP